MNQRIFAQRIARRTGFQVRDCEDIIGEFLHQISQSLILEETLRLQKFGTFRVRHLDGQPDAVRVDFRPSTALLEAMQSQVPDNEPPLNNDEFDSFI